MSNELTSPSQFLTLVKNPRPKTPLSTWQNAHGHKVPCIAVVAGCNHCFRPALFCPAQGQASLGRHAVPVAQGTGKLDRGGIPDFRRSSGGEAGGGRSSDFRCQRYQRADANAGTARPPPEHRTAVCSRVHCWRQGPWLGSPHGWPGPHLSSPHGWLQGAAGKERVLELHLPCGVGACARP